MMRATPTWLAVGVRWCERVVFALPGLAPHAPRRNAIVVLLYFFLLLAAANVVYAVLVASAITPGTVRV